jgi:hypothetical protein
MASRPAPKERGITLDGIYCHNCGAKVDEVPTLLPDQRPPCPRCGSLARRFEQDITDPIALSDSGSGTDAITVTRTVGLDARVVHAHAEVAEGAGEAFDATVRTVRGPRHIIDHLVVQGRSLWWTQLTEEGGWLLQVVDEAGEEIATTADYDPVEALAAVAEFILPGHPG